MTKTPESDTPLYQQVKRHILDQIGSGAWAASARVPSENDLVRSMGVSRMTAHRALKELMEDGYLTRIAGVGTFVSENPSKTHPLEVRDIADDIRARGHDHAARLLSLAAEEASAEIAAAFDLAPKAELFHSLVLHLENGVPIQLEDRYVNPKAVPDYLAQDFNDFTPSAYLLSVAPLLQAEHTVRAVLPTADEAALLEIRAGAPCLMIERRTWTGETIASVARLICPGDRYEISGRFNP